MGQNLFPGLYLSTTFLLPKDKSVNVSSKKTTKQKNSKYHHYIFLKECDNPHKLKLILLHVFNLFENKSSNQINQQYEIIIIKNIENHKKHSKRSPIATGKKIAYGQ